MKPMKKPELTTYLSLCTQVYEISLPTAPADEYEFFTSYAKESVGPILEPMCGTGRFLLPMLQDGFDIEGFDASTHMLDALYSKAKERNLSPKVSLDFVESFKPTEQYSLIFIPSGSFNLITDRTDIAHALKKFYEMLAPHGTLVIEIITLAATPKNPGTWRREKWEQPSGGFILASSCEEPLDDNVSLTNCTHDLIIENSIVTSEQETFKIRLYSIKEFYENLVAAGFSSITPIKAFDRSKSPDASDKDVIFECKK